MSRNVEICLSPDDAHTIEAHQLGAVLGVYQLRADYVHLMRLISSFCLVLIFSILFIIIVNSNKLLKISILDLASLLLIILFVVLAGVALSRSKLSDVKDKHIIICENGIFQHQKNKCVEVVRWKDVRAIGKLFLLPEYSVAYRAEGEFKTLTISRAYQDVDDMVELIIQYSKEIAEDS